MTMDPCTSTGDCRDLELCEVEAKNTGLERQGKREAPEHPPQHSSGVRDQMHRQLNEHGWSPSMKEQMNKAFSSPDEETNICDISMAVGGLRGHRQQQQQDQQLQQLSEKLVEQLHVDAKRSRMSPSYCSLCSVTPFTVSTNHAGSCASYPHDEVSQQVSVSKFADSKSSDHPCRGCSCPCHGNHGAGSIVSIEGPRRPETFAANLAELSRMFPSIHQGLIISLLETAENQLPRARALVRVVSETATGMSKQHWGSETSKRKRCADAEPEGLPVGAVSAAASSFLADKWGCDKSGGAVRQESSSAADPGATISHSDPPGGCTASPMVDTLSVDLSERLLWIYVKSGNASEAKAEAASLLKDYAMQVRLQALRPEDDGTRQDADLAKAVESYRTENAALSKELDILRSDKVLLAKAVKCQHEKIQILKQDLMSKSERIATLENELTQLQGKLKKILDVAGVFLGNATGRVGGPCRENCSFEEPSPDVF